jgi:hypothetical protein
MNELTIKLTKEELGVILVAMQELPAKICNPLTERIKQQAQAQLGRIIKHDISEGIDVEEKFGG